MTRAEPNPAGPPTAEHKHCLLVVDDEPEVCNAVYHLLRRRYHVLRAHSAAEAVELLSTHDVEIILTDQRMPEVSGVQMLARIKARHPEAIRMLYTGYSDIESVVAAVNQGHIYRFLSKPWQPEELEAAVDDAAAEYHRIIRTTEEVARCREKIHHLETENEALRQRLEGEQTG
jgi:response regulator RpfG family c-di-GMP phosphodiesterase